MTDLPGPGREEAERLETPASEPTGPGWHRASESLVRLPVGRPCPSQ